MRKPRFAALNKTLTPRFPRHRSLRGILFDLDGTLADTAPDLANALNRLLVEQDRPPLSFDRIRGHVSRGGAALVRLGFGIGNEHAEFAPLRSRFLELYRERLCVETRLFPGMPDVLASLEAAGLPWGVVTNKPGWLTDPLMDELDLRERAGCVVSGDTVNNRKPHPQPLLHACATLSLPPSECVYVGDDSRDIVAGNAAAMTTIVAGYGYILPDSDPDAWGAHYSISHASALIPLIGPPLRAEERA